MDRAKKKLASALDGFRSIHGHVELELDEKVSPEHVCLTQIVRHGFPNDPRCIAYDCVQRLLAIGSGHGTVRILGDIGVDYTLKHPSDAAVLHIQFLINEGALVTACRDDMVHLWNFRQKVPEIVHSIQLNKEQVTSISLPFQSKWLHVGTERGNVYFVSVATFTLSTYVINWNKAIDLSCRTHPGAVKSILTCPIDASKILILFDKGIVVLWNLSTKEVERYSLECAARSLAWHHDGRQFICGCADGSLVIWNVKKPGECVHKLMPHGQKCRPITQVDWRYSADGEQMVIFSGGVPQDEGVLPALTIMRASRSATVLEMDHPMIAFMPLTSSPYSNLPQHPFAVAVLLKNDLLVIDLNTPGYPCFENLNPMDIHESPLTLLKYFSNCPIDLIGALTLVGCKQRRQGFSDKPWPITGGTGRECATGHQELLLSGHEDGSLKFWQASGEHLQILYKLKTGRHFERSGGSEGRDVSHAIIGVELCLESRLLLVASQSAQVTLFRFVKNESANEIAVVNVPNLGGFSHVMSTEEETTSGNWGTVRELRRQGKAISQDSHSTDTSDGSTTDQFIPLKVRGGALRRPAGYQPELVCLIPWKSASQPEQISSMALNSAYGILAIGTASGLALVDIIQYTLIYSWLSCELYGSEATPSVLVRQNSETVFNDRGEHHHSKNTLGHTASFSAERRPSKHSLVSVRRIQSDAANSRPLPGSSSRRNNGNWQMGKDVISTNKDDSPLHPAVSDSFTAESSGFVKSSKQVSEKHPVRRQHSSLPYVHKRGSAKSDDGLRSPDGAHCLTKTSSDGVSDICLEFEQLLGTCFGCDQVDDVILNCLTSREAAADASCSSHMEYCLSDVSGEHASTSVLDVSRNNEKCEEKCLRAARRSHSTRMTNLVRRLTNGGRVFARSISVQLVDKGDDIVQGSDQGRDQASQSSARTDGREPPSPRKDSPSPDFSEKMLLPEAVTSLCFIHSSFRKHDVRSGPCLWLGTSTGACIAFSLLLPSDRLNSTVVVAPTGSIFRLKGQFLYTAFLDQSFCLLTAASESFRDIKDDNKATCSNNGAERSIMNKVVTKGSLSPSFSNASECSKEDEFSQIVIMVSEEEVKLISLPNFNQLFSHRPDIPFVMARATHVRGHPVLMLLNSAGQIVVLSLPTLRPLICSPLFRRSLDLNDPMCQKTSFSEHGLGIYAATPSEVQKFTVCSELAGQVRDCMGDLFVPVDMPEPPRSSFLKGVSTLFSQKESVDLDSIFVDKNSSTTSGSGMRSIAKTIPGPSASLDQATSRGISAGQAANLAVQALHERSEKLGATVDATERLKDNAMRLSQRTGKLVEKYEKKKWYNF